MVIRVLPDHLINQIAAGEVLERPAAAVKELVENAIDAGATRIEIDLSEGGRELIIVTDNGKGMSREDLNLCVERHATSKLSDDDLTKIQTMGFRGEALPSIAAVSRLTLISAIPDSNEGWSLEIVAGERGQLRPAAYRPGTRIEVKDLFFATPARLKFMKTPAVEKRHCVEKIEQLALAHPEIAFRVAEKGKVLLDVAAAATTFDRIVGLYGKSLADNLVEVEAEREGYHLTGAVSLPTFDKPGAAEQHFFVNRRWVKDKIFGHSLKVAYQDVLSKDKTPFACLYVTMPLREVDINVHPSKIEVRFIDSQLVRGLLISGIRSALAKVGQKTAPQLIENLVPFIPKAPPTFPSTPPETRIRVQSQLAFAEPVAPHLYRAEVPALIQEVKRAENGFLGRAVAQIHNSYVVAETPQGLVLVDQHAAHERINYEKLKQNLKARTVQRQRLLLPEIIDMRESDVDLLLTCSHDLVAMGFVVERFGVTAIRVIEVPVLLTLAEIRPVVTEFIEMLKDEQDQDKLLERLHEKLAEHACKNSIKAGDQMSLTDMNDLLRQIEATPQSAQCNHGRPTYVELKLPDIERLFGRR